MIHRVFHPAALATLLCALSAPALAQTEAPRRPQAQPRGYLDYFAAGVSRAYAGGDAGSGFGARLMVRVAPAGSPLGRVLVGGYASHLPRTGSGGDTWQYGSQADVHVRGPGSRFDPMLTLAAGAVRREGEWTWQVANRRPLRVFRDGARTGYTLSPGMAARAHVTRAVALRGDIRRAFALDGDARGGTEYAVGISLPF